MLEIIISVVRQLRRHSIITLALIQLPIEIRQTILQASNGACWKAKTITDSKNAIL